MLSLPAPTVRSTAVMIVVLFMPAAALHGAPSSSERFRQLHEQVAAYLTLKTSVAASLPDRRQATSFEEYVDAIDRLRLGVQRARGGVSRGAIFVPNAQPVLRILIAETLQDHGISAAGLRAAMKDDRPRDARPVRLNEPFPLERGFMMPACLLEALPWLPRNIQYRIDDRNLVLVDVEINLVLDILLNALPER